MTAPAPSFNNNAFEMLAALLRSWGLETLSPALKDMLIAGDSPEVVPIKLRETNEYKTRFAGLIARQKAGHSPLTEAEYLDTETALKSVVRRSLGMGRYDTQDQLGKWISSDVSPQELQDKLNMHTENYLNQPQWVKDAWSTHGFTPNDAITATIDPKVDENTLKTKLTGFALGAEALQAYRDKYDFNQDRVMDLAKQGVTVNDARKGFQEVAARQDRESSLARGMGMDLTQTEQENAALLADETAQQKRRKVLNTDQARYQDNYLGGVNTLSRDAAGSY